ncbi:MAG TPA: ribosome small subunit-dependent GTPase A [Clostridiales bacterium]|nr:ribosome small subunit-dependent GTPase A [Clostridiales bacterium]
MVAAPGGLLECRPRGRMRRTGEQVLVGDEVRVKVITPGEAAIEGILPRKTQLERPPVANADQAVLVTTVRDPESSLLTLDRLLVQAIYQGLAALICLNKVDLLAAGGADGYLAPYRRAGFRTVATSATTGQGIAELRQELAGVISVLAGESGVGKSSLLNALRPGLALRTGNLGATGRGRHTTRHLELLEVSEHGLVADTPGLSLVSLPAMPPGRLAAYWPELAELAPDCRFRTCVHRQEPGCRVRAARGSGELDQGRYERYLSLLREVELADRRY